MYRRVISLAAAVVLSSSSALLLSSGSASAEPVSEVPDLGSVSELAAQPNGLAPNLDVPELPVDLEQLLGLLELPVDSPNPLQIAKDACEGVVDLVDELAPPDLSQFKRLCGLLDLPLGAPGDDGSDDVDEETPVADAGSQVTLVPAGSVDTGDGTTTGGDGDSAIGFLAGALALAGAGGAAVVVRRRTQRDS
jgi:hypothetical protein